MAARTAVIFRAAALWPPIAVTVTVALRVMLMVLLRLMVRRRSQHRVLVRFEIQLGHGFRWFFHVVVVVIPVMMLGRRVAQVRGWRRAVRPVRRRGRCRGHWARGTGLLRLGRGRHRWIGSDLTASPHQHGQRAGLRIKL